MKFEDKARGSNLVYYKDTIKETLREMGVKDESTIREQVCR